VTSPTPKTNAAAAMSVASGGKFESSDVRIVIASRYEYHSVVAVINNFLDDGNAQIIRSPIIG
jgi:hypothetical protein